MSTSTRKLTPTCPPFLTDWAPNVTSLLTSAYSGGEEVLLDVAGQDATEAFEDVGHSDEAREILDGLKVGTLKRVAGDPAPKPAGSDKIAAGPAGSDAGPGGLGLGLYAIVLVGGLAAYFAYTFMAGQNSK